MQASCRRGSEPRNKSYLHLLKENALFRDNLRSIYSRHRRHVANEYVNLSERRCNHISIHSSSRLKVCFLSMQLLRPFETLGYPPRFTSRARRCMLHLGSYCKSHGHECLALQSVFFAQGLVGGKCHVVALAPNWATPQLARENIPTSIEETDGTKTAGTVFRTLGPQPAVPACTSCPVSRFGSARVRGPRDIEALSKVGSSCWMEVARLKLPPAILA